MEQYFDINRFFLVLKRDLIENGRSALFGMLTVLSIFSFILLMTALNADQNVLSQMASKLYLLEFWIIGLFFSGMAFKDLRNKEKTMTYLMLPASSLEKFLSMLLLSTVGFVISYTVLFGAFNILNIGIIQSLSPDLTLEFYNPFQMKLWMNIWVFLSIQSIFLVGAVSFKKVPLFYTVLYTFLLGLIYTFLMIFVSRFLFGEMFQSVNFGEGGMMHFHYSIQSYDSDVSSLPLNLLRLFFQYLIAPVFWIVAWFKIKEKEV